MADKINLKKDPAASDPAGKGSSSGPSTTGSTTLKIEAKPAGGDLEVKPAGDKPAAAAGPTEKPAGKPEVKPPEAAGEKKSSPITALLSLGKKKESLEKKIDSPLAKSGDKETGKKDIQSIFSRKDTKEKDSKIMSSVLQKKAPPKVKPILGAAPTLQKSIEEEKVAKQKRTLRLVQVIFLIVFLASLGMAFYFYSELSPTFDLFGANSTARLTDVNKNLRSAQTSINKYRYLAAQLDLNTFSFVSDEFLDKTSSLSLGDLTPAEEAALTSTVNDSVSHMPSLLTTVQENLGPDIMIDTYRTEAEEEKTTEQIQQEFVTDLRNVLLDDRRALASDTELSDANAQELRLIDNTLKLVGNNKLIGVIKNASVTNFESDLLNYIETLDPIQRESLQTMMGGILASTKSDIATVGALKAQRTSWLWIITKIEEVTAEVDPNFNSGLFEVTGLEVIYTGYELDANTGKVILSGNTKTIDAKNFSLISDLLDAFELSPYFENVEMRSFSKSGNVEQGFTASFKIDLSIEVEGISPKNKPISLESRPVAVKSTGVRRTK